MEDMVHAQRLLVEYLGIDVLEAVIGGSMGGMQALQWSVSYPDKLRKCLCLAASASLSAQALSVIFVVSRNQAGMGVPSGKTSCLSCCEHAT
jgi:homoserine acetyltransferase